MRRGFHKLDWAEALDEFLKAREEYLPAAKCLVVRSVWALDEKETWTHLFTRATFQEDAVQDLDVDEYQGVRVFVRCLSLDDGVAVIRGIPQEGISGLAEELPETEFKGDVSLEYRDRNKGPRESTTWQREPQLPWSEVVLTKDAAGKPSLPPSCHRLYSSRTGPVFEDAGDFIKHWTRCMRWDAAYTWSRGVYVDFQDRRGRITAVRVSDWLAGEISVSTESIDAKIERMAFVAGTTSGVLQRGDLGRGADGSTWSTIARPDWVGVHLFAMAENGEIIEDYPPLRMDSIPLELADTLSQSEVCRLIDEGESDELELKSWRLLDSDGARKHVVKTVIAMANTEGGVFLLGVTDDGQVDGPEHNDDGVMPVEVQEAAAEVKNWITEHIEPSVVVKIRPVVHDGHYLLSTTVEPSEKRPHSDKGGRFFVRSGASSRPAWHRDVVGMCKGL